MCEIQGYIHTSVLVCVGSSPPLTSIEGIVPLITIWLIVWYNCHSPHSPGPLHLHSWTHSDELWPKDRTFDNTSETINAIFQQSNAPNHFITMPA